MDTTARPSTIRWEEPDDHIVTLVLDDPDQSANTMNAAFIDSLDAVAARLAERRDAIRGVIVTSAKKSFFAGGDLRDLKSVTPETAGAAYEAGMRVKRSLRVLETLGRPVVAAINGAALGGGYEIALACHHRVVLDTPAARVGLPEVTLGLLPGGGGATRTVRMFGVADALRKVLPEGTQYGPARAPEAGLVDEIAHSCAGAGIDVVLKDVSVQAAAQGRAYSEKLCARAVSRGDSTREQADALPARILSELAERMLFAEALDAVRCLEEGVLVSVADANIGSLLGIGFPPWTGGVLQYINGYDGGAGGGTGLPGFAARAREPAGKHGDRFAPPELLLRKAGRCETFTDS